MDAIIIEAPSSTKNQAGNPFLYLKRRFGYANIRYWGLAKNTQCLTLLLGRANLIIVEGHRTV